MNLFFRLLLLLIRDRFFVGPIGYLETATLRHRVWITDQDAFMHMNNTRYMSIADLAVIDLTIRTGVFRAMRKAGLTPVVVYKDIGIHRPLKFPQDYEVQSRICGWNGPYVFFEHSFLRKGKLHAEAVTIGRIIGKRGERPTAQEMIETLGLDSLPESPPVSKRLLAEVSRLEERRTHDSQSSP